MPTDLTAVEKFCALLRPRPSPGRRKPATAQQFDQLTAQLLPLSSQLPTYMELQEQLKSSFFANRHLDPEAMRYLGLESIAIHLLEQDSRQAPHSPLLGIMQILIDKGYGQLPKKYSQSHPSAFLQLIGRTPMFSHWSKQQDPESFFQFLSGAQLDTSNIAWILKEKPDLASDPQIFITLCLRLGSAMDQAIIRKDWTGKKPRSQVEPTTIQDISDVAKSLKTYTAKVSPETNMEAWYGIVGKNALLHPQWSRSVFGENPGFDEFSLPDTLDNLKPGSTFMEKSSANTEAWEKDTGLFQKMLHQIPYFGDISSDLSDLDSPLLFSLYLDHPAISRGPQFNHRRHSLKIIENLDTAGPTNQNAEYLGKVEECVEKVYRLEGNLAAFDFYRLCKAGAGLETVKKAFRISHREKGINQVSFAWIVEANRPELLSLFPEQQVPWVRVGAHLPKNTISLTSEGMQPSDTPWKIILEGPYGKSCRQGYICTRILEQHSEAPGFIRQHPWLRDQELGEAVLSTQLLGQLGKKANIHTALEVASALHLKPSTMAREAYTVGPNKEGYAPKEITLLELAAASPKPNFLLRYRDMGGIFASRGLEAAINAKKTQNLEIMLTAPSGNMDQKLPEKYLSKMDDRISPTFLKLVKICQPEPLSLLRALSGTYHHAPDLSLLYGLLLEQNEPQNLFSQMVQEGGPICEQHPELLRQAVYHGADPGRPVWVYDFVGFSQQSLPYLLPQIKGSQGGDLGQELLDIYQARQQARKALNRPESLEIELF